MLVFACRVWFGLGNFECACTYKKEERETRYAPPLVCETVSVPMSRVSRTFTSEENCRNRYENGAGMFNGHATLDNLINHAIILGDIRLVLVVFWAHMYNYIACARDLNKQQAREIGGVVIREPSEDDIKLLTERIQASEWNMQNIHNILFSDALDFTHDQVWDLAGVIAERKEKHDIENPPPRRV
jgi:hypothetical protein